MKKLNVMQAPASHFKARKRLFLKNTTVTLFFISALFLISCNGRSSKFPVQISVDKTEIGMGRTVNVEAFLKNNNPDDHMILLPFVNGRRWGSHEFAGKDGKARFIIPLPNPGPALIQVIAVPADTNNWQGLTSENKLLKAGAYMPDSVNRFQYHPGAGKAPEGHEKDIRGNAFRGAVGILVPPRFFMGNGTGSSRHGFL